MKEGEAVVSLMFVFLTCVKFNLQLEARVEAGALLSPVSAYLYLLIFLKIGTESSGLGGHFSGMVLKWSGKSEYVFYSISNVSPVMLNCLGENIEAFHITLKYI